MLSILLFQILVRVASARFLVSTPVLKIMYGNIGIMDGLELPPRSRRADFDSEITYGEPDTLPDFYDYINEIEDIQQWTQEINNSTDIDIKDLDSASKYLTDIKKDLENVAKEHLNNTRRQIEMELPNEINQMWRDPVQLREWYYMKITLTYLIHIRFQVDMAIRQKMAVNAYAAYRIGYLFNRLMKIRSNMHRVMEEWNTLQVQRVVQNRPNWRTNKHSLQMLLQLYERMLQLDVDHKDSVEMVMQLTFGRKQYVTEEQTTPSKPFFK